MRIYKTTSLLLTIFLVFSTAKAESTQLQIKNADPIEIERNLNKISKVFNALNSSFYFTEQVIDQFKKEAKILKSKNNRIHSSVNNRELIFFHFKPTLINERTKTFLYIGGIHADEYTPFHITQRLISDILLDKQLISNNHNIIFIPFLNIDGWIDGFKNFRYPTRKNANNVDLNRSFYSRNQLPDKQSEPETEFILDIIDKFNPNYVIIPHSTLNILDLDGSKEQRHLNWLEEIHNLTLRATHGEIPIKSHGTYSPPNSYQNWSFGKLANYLYEIETDITSLTYEFGGPGPIPAPNDPNRALKIAKRKHLGRFEDNTFLADEYYEDYRESLLRSLRP